MTGDPAAEAKAFGLTSVRPIIFARSSEKKKMSPSSMRQVFNSERFFSTRQPTVPNRSAQNLYVEALAAFRAVALKEEIIALQQNKVREFVTKKAAALRANNASLKKQLDRDNERELKKLAELQGKPDQTATAQLKMAENFQQGKNNEARVVLRHVAPFSQRGRQEARALFHHHDLRLQNAADEATAGYDEFQSKL